MSAVGTAFGCADTEEIQPLSKPTTATVGAAEDVFDMLKKPQAVRKIAASAGVKATGEFSGLYDGDPSTGVTFELAPGGGPSSSYLEVELASTLAINEISVEIDPTQSDGNYTTLLSHGAIEDDEKQVFSTIADDVETDPKAKRVSYLRAADGRAVDAPVARLVFRAARPADKAVTVRITEVHAFERPSAAPLGGAALKLFDVHFHPCAFSNLCTSVDVIDKEQTRYNISGAFLFGLQHNMVRGLSPWAKTVGDTYDTSKIPIPFHYNDPGGRISSQDGALPGLDQLNQQLMEANKPAVEDYNGWRVYPTMLADWNTMSAYAKSPAALKEKHYPFLSSMRLDKADAENGYKYGVCTKNPETSRYWNEDLLRAFDALFPGTVHGYAEYNLNKVVMFTHDSYAPLVDAEWLECMTPVMSYLAASGRPIGFHNDIAETNHGTNGFDSLLTVAEAFPDTIMIWHHGGVAPEVATTLSAAEHLDKLTKFLATSPGKRYVELSWGRGFFLRLDRQKLGDEEVAAAGTKQPRDWAADFSAYLDFFAEHQDALLFGSDQVALFYPIAISEDLDGGVFVNHINYMQGQTYGGALREELGLLRRAVDGATGGRALDVSTLEKLFSGNAEGIVAKVVPPDPGMTEDAARAALKQLVKLQYDENALWAGSTAPTAEEFIPAELR